MKKRFYKAIALIGLLLSIYPCSISAESSQLFEKQKLVLRGKIEKKKYKEAQQTCNRLIMRFPNKKSELLLQKAICYAHDQEIERSLKVFLEAIESAPVVESKQAHCLIYEQALEAYLDPEPKSNLEKGKNLQFEFSSYYEKHKTNYPLGFIIAASHAMLGNYPQFLEVFYENFCNCPKHYLVDRILGQVYLKLVKYTSQSSHKERYREKASDHFFGALQKYPQDSLLYRLSYLLAPQAKKKERLESNLNLLVQTNASLNRLDLFPYVREALDHGHIDLTEQLINKAKTWYSVSRSLKSAENYYHNFQEKLKNQGEP